MKFGDPLGANLGADGAAFSLFSRIATQVELCLFEKKRRAWKECDRIALQQDEGFIWRAFCPGVRAGQAYAYRVSGPWDPERGHFCNPNKILLDPYAKALARLPKWDERLLGHSKTLLSSASTEDSAEVGPLAAVAGRDDFSWGDAKPPRIAWEKTILYETHVKGMTALHPGIPREVRGTYSALASDPVIEHLQKLNITSVELLPVHQHFPELHLHATGKENYWGYFTLNFFTPDHRYCAGDPLNAAYEFRSMVKRFHQAGIEVILDVVYNHTAEANTAGPLLSFRGIDNTAYYRVVKDSPGRYEDFTGCGNTLDLRNPMVLRLVLDSLRYWVTEMHVDGFRFDLTSALIRESPEVNTAATFLQAVGQDPVLSNAKLIAEPWDCCMGSYQVGNFPAPWRDWNGQFRDVSRMFWRGDPGKIGAMASRLAGSSDMFGGKGRAATSSINFITAHDGFTLADLVSYNEKHNLDNGEENRDGESNNFSHNCGAEGETDDSAVLARREVRKRGLFATLAFATGVPMMLGGDELSRSQSGNNNSYCQDNELNWFSWELDRKQEAFLAFCRHALKIRSSEPLLQRTEFFAGEANDKGVKDVTWLSAKGGELSIEEWTADRCDPIGMHIRSLTEKSHQLLLLFNPRYEEVSFRIPAASKWELLLDTHQSREQYDQPYEIFESKYYNMLPQSLILLRHKLRAK